MLNRIYNVANPMNLLDELWKMIEDKEDLSNILIFLPSHRTIRQFEKMIVEKRGHAVLLPKLVPLGTGLDSGDEEEIISDQARVVTLASMLAAAEQIKTISAALPLAHDFIRMQDYLENEGIDITKDINWDEIFYTDESDNQTKDTKKAKSELLKILTAFIKKSGVKTNTTKRNEEILAFKNVIEKYDMAIVCGSTASVPVTADLMDFIARSDNGTIILSGKIEGDKEDLEKDTHPYFAENKFLEKLGLTPKDVKTLPGVENKYLGFLNGVFSDNGDKLGHKLDNVTLVECVRESQESALVVELAAQEIDKGKTVLIVTPDEVANQRIKTAMKYRNIVADFSIGVPGTMTDLGRALLNLFDDWSEQKDFSFEEKFEKSGCDIYEMLVDFVDTESAKEPKDKYRFRPIISLENREDFPIWQSIKNMSDALKEMYQTLKGIGKIMSIYDIRAFVADAISLVSVREPAPKDYKIAVLGTIESRMQKADVVILTGLNEGMFPSEGYKNFWVPSSVAEQNGFPSPNKKVSLMALDFINMSCADKVYWLRTLQSGGTENIESRFISRVRVYDPTIQPNKELLKLVDDKDIVKYDPISDEAPVPRTVDNSDVYVTELEYLLNNPYAFYVKHILRLNKNDEYWALPDQRKFGDIVHYAVQQSTDMTEQDLLNRMRESAKDVKENHAVIYRFWDTRFAEIAKFVSKHVNELKDIITADIETTTSVQIGNRNVCARADAVWQGAVLDIKTGKTPEEKKLKNGEAPQVPLEGYMMQEGKFQAKLKPGQQTPDLMFLRLKKNNTKIISFTDEVAQEMIENTVEKIKEVFAKYSEPDASYEYITKSDGKKYKIYDDFARRED